ncbi:MAG: hypothetical protein ACMG6E_09295 [Candidatus Roizmanbacteria bacterium]
MEAYTLVCTIYFFKQWKQTVMVYVNKTFIEPLTIRYGYGTKDNKGGLYEPESYEGIHPLKAYITMFSFAGQVPKGVGID